MVSKTSLKPLGLESIKPVRSDVRIVWAMGGAGARESIGDLVGSRVLSKVTDKQKILGMSLSNAGALLAGYFAFKMLPDDPDDISIMGFGKGFAAGLMIDAGGQELKDRGFDIAKIIFEKSGVKAGTAPASNGTRTVGNVGADVISLDGL